MNLRNVFGKANSIGIAYLKNSKRLVYDERKSRRCHGLGKMVGVCYRGTKDVRLITDMSFSEKKELKLMMGMVPINTRLYKNFELHDGSDLVENSE